MGFGLKLLLEYDKASTFCVDLRSRKAPAKIAYSQVTKKRNDLSKIVDILDQVFIIKFYV